MRTSDRSRSAILEEDGRNIEICELCYSSDFAPRKLTCTRGNTK